jgi:hypothetical protein
MIDKADMQISLIQCLRKSDKWYRKLFFHMLDLSVFNSYLLYKGNTKKKLNFQIIIYNLFMKSYQLIVFQNLR